MSSLLIYFAINTSRLGSTIVHNYSANDSLNSVYINIFIISNSYYKVIETTCNFSRESLFSFIKKASWQLILVYTLHF